MDKKYLVPAAVIGFVAVSVSAVWFLVFSNSRDYTGRFERPHDVPVWVLKDERSCAGKGGSFGPDGCAFEVVDEVVVRQTDEGMSLKVSTVSANLGYCSYEGKAAEEKGGTLVSKVLAKGLEGTSKDNINFECRIRVDYLSKDVINVTDNGNCAEFCKKKATFAMGGARRVR